MSILPNNLKRKVTFEDEEEPPNDTKRHRVCAKSLMCSIMLAKLSEYDQVKTNRFCNFSPQDLIGYGNEILDKFAKFYKEDPIIPYEGFTAYGCFGIPNNICIFQDFNMDICLLAERRDFIHAKLSHFMHVRNYFEDPLFTAELLKNTKYDHVCFAILAYILEWDDESIKMFGDCVGKQAFTNALVDARNLDGGKFLFEWKGLFVLKTGFKILKKIWIEPQGPKSTIFSIREYIDRELIYSTARLHKHLLKSLELANKKSQTEDLDENGNWDEDEDRQTIDELENELEYEYQKLISELETRKPPMISLPILKYNFASENPQKYITGVACCGKTTLLKKFVDRGWNVYSRGGLGSFSGKARDPATIGTMHMAINYILRQPHNIGDRGQIDNILWHFIMAYCDPTKQSNLVDDLVDFFDSNFNEPSIAEFISHKVHVILDLKPKCNYERMLKRGTNGDCFRGRLKYYASTQTVAYYFAAKLFGWTVHFVPYKEDGSIDSDLYNSKIMDIVNYYGDPEYCEECVRFPKPSGNFIICNDYAKSVGIYK